MTKLAYTYRAAISILDAKGLNEDEILAYIKDAEKPTEGYIYIK